MRKFILISLVGLMSIAIYLMIAFIMSECLKIIEPAHYAFVYSIYGLTLGFVFNNI